MFLSKTLNPPLSTGSTQEDNKSSRHKLGRKEGNKRPRTENQHQNTELAFILSKTNININLEILSFGQAVRFRF